ncbi:MAG: sulfite exporter TauE/SafE family protein [Bacteroidetes bacterium]|nr:sulfite exporter TauE/SafE family protein [Bacteroidota bacterium]
MELLLIAVVAAAASLITLFSGFGLGTILTPVFLLFFPLETAIALTGIVHLLNNLFKAVLLGRHTHWPTLLRFGVPSMLGAFLGAQLLHSLTLLPSVGSLTAGPMMFHFHPVKMVIALVMIVFALMELIPSLQPAAPSARLLPVGGLMSGFFGGLSGHQGALRSAFLIRYGLGKEAFLATGIMIAVCVDLTRLSLYASNMLGTDLLEHRTVLITATLSAFAGAYLGSTMLTKITHRTVQRIVAVMLILIALGLGVGLL